MEDLAIQAAKEEVFQQWEAEEHQHWTGLFQSGKFVRRYMKTRAKVLLEKAILYNGMYLHHDIPLNACLKKHQERWTNVSRLASDLTKTFLVQMAKRCLGMGEIVLIIGLLKTRYFLGKIPEEICSNIKKLNVPHYNPDLDWFSICHHIAKHAKTRQIVTCPELDVVFTRCLYIIVNALVNRPFLFESNIALLDSLYQTNWDSTAINDKIYQSLCFGGLSPSEISDGYNKGCPLQYYQNFENGIFTELDCLLLTVQITIRATLLMEARPEQQFVNKKELEGQFGNLKLFKILEVLERDELYDLFKYPTSFSDGQKPYMRCVLTLDDVPYTLAIELAVLYWLFGELQQEDICSSLEQHFVTKKKQEFLKPSRSTVMYNGVSYPKKWTKFNAFKKLFDS
jgi:hypothetical protein